MKLCLLCGIVGLTFLAGRGTAFSAAAGAATTAAPDFSLKGFATTGFTTAGGTGGEIVTVISLEQFNEYGTSKLPLVIQFAGTIRVEGMNARLGSNKTLIGLGTNATLLGGGLYLHSATNVIIRNLTVDSSSDDSFGVVNSRHVWIDHCTFKNARDGNLDINRGSDYITVSWCRFYYDTPQPHALASLLGSSDRDFASQNKLHVTYHHNWFGQHIKERMPSIRFGTVHLFNNYYHAPGNNYCIRSRLFAAARIESNCFEAVRNPWEVYITDPTNAVGKIFATNNLELNTVWGNSSTNTRKGLSLVQIVPGTDDVFQPPYSYEPDPAAAVPSLVTNFAGAGKGTFAP
jgi:pectate lyase